MSLDVPSAVTLVAPVLAAALVAQASPGPATLAISREAMLNGRKAGVALALGVTTGSWIWSAVAAGGMSAVVLSQEWAIVGLRFVAAAYLGWLAFRSAKSVFAPPAQRGALLSSTSPGTSTCYMRGLLIHLTNPKAVLFFAALYAFGLPLGATTEAVLVIAGAVALQSLVVFTGFALLFSHRWLAEGYWRFRRGLEALFALVFGTAALGFLSSALRPLLTHVP